MTSSRVLVSLLVVSCRDFFVAPLLPVVYPLWAQGVLFLTSSYLNLIFFTHQKNTFGGMNSRT